MSGESIKKLNGKNGQLEVYPQKITIKRKGILAKMTHGFTKGEKTIYINKISGIQFKKGGNFTNGYLQFTLSGGNESSKGIMSATKDENSILFDKSKNDLAKEIKEYLEKQINPSQNTIKNKNNLADELRDLKKLVEEGVLTEEEFQRKKKKMLSEN